MIQFPESPKSAEKPVSQGPRAPVWIGVAGWLLVIAACTLRPAPLAAAEIARLPWYCIVCGDNGVADVFLNVLLFLPLGLGLHALHASFRRTLLLVLTLSIAIEVVQGLFLVGRDACVGDVLSNTTGGMLGWLSLGGIQVLLRPTHRFAVRGIELILPLMLFLWLATASGLRPSLPETFPWIGQPARAGRGPVQFPGTFERASFDGIDIPDFTMAVVPPWRDSLSIALLATRTTSQKFDRGIVLLRIVDSAHTVLVAMDQRGDDAWLRLRLHAADWRLHSPRWLVSHAMQMAPGQPWLFQWTWLHDRFAIVNKPLSAATPPALEVPLSIGLGWVFIHPFVNEVSGTRILWTALWLGFWFGILGWLAGQLRRRTAALVGIMAIAIFVGASAWSRLPVQAGEIAAAVIAYSVLVLAAWIRRRSGA